MNQTQGTIVTNIAAAATTPPGISSRSSKSLQISRETKVMRPFLWFYLALGGFVEFLVGHVSWTQVLLCSVRAKNFAFGVDLTFRSGLVDSYHFLIQNLKSYTKHSAPCLCFFTWDVLSLLLLVE